jgi:hypothetical protein
MRQTDFVHDVPVPNRSSIDVGQAGDIGQYQTIVRDPAKYFGKDRIPDLSGINSIRYEPRVSNCNTLDRGQDYFSPSRQKPVVKTHCDKYFVFTREWREKAKVIARKHLFLAKVEMHNAKAEKPRPASDASGSEGLSQASS